MLGRSLCIDSCRDQLLEVAELGEVCVCSQGSGYNDLHCLLDLDCSLLTAHRMDNNM